MKNFIIIVVIVVVALIAGVWWFTSTTQFDPQENVNEESLTEDAEVVGTVAIINGEEIPAADYNAQRAQILSEQGVDPATLDQQTKDALKAQVVELLVSRTLVQQAALNSTSSVEDAAVDSQIEMIKGQFPTIEEFNEALSLQSMTEEELRSQVRTELITQAYLDETLDLPSITASQEEVTAAYDELAAGQEMPALDTVQSQVEEFVIQQKKQEKISEHIAELRAQAQVEVLI